MKATGIVRKIDNLGRIVIPKELRTVMKINKKDPMEVYVNENNEVVLSKYKPKCIFCGSSEDTIEFKKETICKECFEELKNKNNKSVKKT